MAPLFLNPECVALFKYALTIGYRMVAVKRRSLPSFEQVWELAWDLDYRVPGPVTILASQVHDSDKGTRLTAVPSQLAMLKLISTSEVAVGFLVTRFAAKSVEAMRRCDSLSKGARLQWLKRLYSLFSLSSHSQCKKEMVGGAEVQNPEELQARLSLLEACMLDTQLCFQLAGTCVCCTKAVREHRFAVCGHSVLCRGCAAKCVGKTMKCPWC